MLVLKIAFVCQPLSTGGAERVVAALANRFFELGHEVKVVVVDNGDENVYYTHEQIEFVHIEKPSNPIVDLFHRASVMRRFFKDYAPDIILPFTTQKNVSTLLATLFTKHKVIISERNDPFKDPQSKFLRILRKLLYFTADGFVFQTEEAKCFFSKKIQRRSCVINNPLSEDLPDPWIGERKKNIVMVNRLDPQKNLKMAIDAFDIVVKKYPESKLEIFGKGPLHEEIKNYADSKGLSEKVVLHGFCNQVTKETVDAGMFLITSNFEGMSNSLMESLAIGLPCISTDHPIGGARVLIDDHENGLLIPVGDTEACASAIFEIIENKGLCEKVSHNAAKIKDKLSVEQVADQWLEYIGKVVGRV